MIDVFSFTFRLHNSENQGKNPHPIFSSGGHIFINVIVKLVSRSVGIVRSRIKATVLIQISVLSVTHTRLPTRKLPDEVFSTETGLPMKRVVSMVMKETQRGFYCSLRVDVILLHCCHWGEL
jgi:hypothetical protein